MGKIKNYLRNIYRLALPAEKQENLVWKEVLSFFEKEGWPVRIYEDRKIAAIRLPLSRDRDREFFFGISDHNFFCMVDVVSGFPDAVINDLFILATHYNNILNEGSVQVGVEERNVLFTATIQVIIPLLYRGVIEDQIFRHVSAAEDAFDIFEKLVYDGEEPAIIMAGLYLKSKERSEREAVQ